MNLAYRWFCRLDLTDRIPDHSTFSKNRHGRFRESCLLRQVIENEPCRANGLDLSRFDAAPLIAFIATKETDYGNEADRRIPG